MKTTTEYTTSEGGNLKIGEGAIYQNKFIYTDRWGDIVEVEVRNVASKNPENALQFSLHQFQRGKRNWKNFGFSLPKEAIPAFIKALKEVRE